MLLRFSRRQEGFSLVEVMAALFVFTLLTLGLVPLLTSSIRGSNSARADTIGKNAALKAMERVRGLPFHISYATSTNQVDVLDLYYPNGTGDIAVGGRTLYRIDCPSGDPGNGPACPVDIPEGYAIRFEAQFVDPVATGTQPTPGETATSYTNVAPAATYRWDSVTNDTPPRQILQMAITATWTVGGSDESYTITSLISDRSFGERKVKGTATVGYGMDIYTAYDSNDGGGEDLSSGNGYVVSSESDIEGRRLSTARQTTTAFRGELQDDNGGSLGSVVAAASNVLQAPPNQQPGTTTAAAGDLEHPDFDDDDVFVFGPSAVIDPAALATSALPSGVGDAEITGAIPGRADYVQVFNPQLENSDTGQLNLTPGAPLVRVLRSDGLPGPLPGITLPNTTGDGIVGGSRSAASADDVTAQATIGIDRILMFDTNWADLSNTEAVFEGGTLTGLGHLIVIDNLQISVTCDSNTDGSGSGEAQYQGTLYYWEDPVQNGSRADGRYRRIDFNVNSSSGGADPLATVFNQNFQAGQPNGPLIYDQSSANQRIYLFGRTLGGQWPGAGTDRLAYLESWSSLTTTASRVDSSTDATGAAVSSVNSTVDGAIEIETDDLDGDRRDESSSVISIGSLSCFAEDQR